MSDEMPGVDSGLLGSWTFWSKSGACCCFFERAAAGKNGGGGRGVRRCNVRRRCLGEALERNLNSTRNASRVTDASSRSDNAVPGLLPPLLSKEALLFRFLFHFAVIRNLVADHRSQLLAHDGFGVSRNFFECHVLESFFPLLLG